MTTRTRAPHLATGAAAAIAAVGVTLSVSAWAAPPSTDPGGSAAPETTTEPQGTYESGVFTAPDGSFTANFAGAPQRSVEGANGNVTYLFAAVEDGQSVVQFPPTALGASAESTATERAELFLAASGSDIEELANTPTNLGPFPASHFAARLTLADDRTATVYGVLADRGSDVAYAFYTDIGDDDNAAAIAFVQSFAIVLPDPPLPTTTAPPTTTVAAADPSAATTVAPSTVGPSTVPPATGVDDAPTSSAVPTTTTAPPPPTVAEAPDGAILGFDGRWWIGFPSGVSPTFRASTDEGFAFAEYLAVDGDDTLIVRITEVPPEFEWNADEVPAAAADRAGGEVLESSAVDVDGRPAVRFSFAQDDSDTSGDTVEALVINGGDQVYSVEFWDGGADSPDAAAEFVDSFSLA